MVNSQVYNVNNIFENNSYLQRFHLAPRSKSCIASLLSVILKRVVDHQSYVDDRIKYQMKSI